MECSDIDFLEDYSTICAYWTKQGHPIITQEYLPKIGKKVTNDGRIVCAGWLYQTDSKMCWIEWNVACPQASKETRRAALAQMNTCLAKTATQLGFKMVYTCIRHHSMQHLARDLGFIQTNENCSVFFKPLGE